MMAWWTYRYPPNTTAWQWLIKSMHPHICSASFPLHAPQTIIDDMSYKELNRQISEESMEKIATSPVCQRFMASLDTNKLGR